MLSPAGGAVLADIMATMERFLQVQQQQESAQTQLMTSYLEAQEAMTLRLMGRGSFPSALPTTNGHQPTNHATVPASPSTNGHSDQHREASPPAEVAYPFAGEVLRLVPGQELESRLVLDVDRHPFLADHSFIKVPESLKPVQERLPILPMTFGIEVLAEAAAILVPGAQVIACQDIEASRWLALESSRTLPLLIRARRIGENEVDAEVRTQDKDKPALRGRVILGRRCRRRPHHERLLTTSPAPTRPRRSTPSRCCFMDRVSM